jgi:hypothetical protein
MNSVSTKLQERMALNIGGSFPEFMSNAIIEDDAIHAHKENKKRKVVAAPSGSSPPKYRMVYHPPRPTYQQQQWACHPPQHPHQQIALNALPPPPPVLRLPAPPTTEASSSNICFNYGRTSHFGRECTAPWKNMTQGHVNHLPCVQQKVVIAKTDCVNYTTMEVVPKNEQVLTGTFSLNGRPIIILFDSGATHNFISKACTHKCQFAITHLSTPYMISTRGEIVTNFLAKNTPLNLAGRIYQTGLIILGGQGIDVILGMSWIRELKALLHTSARTMQLDSPDHGIVTLRLASSSNATPSVQHITILSLEEIPVVCEFPDVFLVDLASMPSPDHGIVTLRLASSSNATPSVQHITILSLEEILVVCKFPDVFPDDLASMPLD